MRQPSCAAQRRDSCPTDFKTYVITPNVNFQFSEQCTVTIDKNGVHDQDTDDVGPNTDTLVADYTWSFTVVAPGAPAPYPPSVHLTMGNPSNATPFASDPNNYLMVKPTYSLSYNRDKGTPNWVSWHLEPAWFGSLVRFDTFRPDPAVLPDWYRVQATDYSGTGFDRGHMTPNADRDNENRIPINQETYLMSNMVPQAPDNNQGPWADLENDLRSLLNVGGAQEMYIVSGPLGVGGSGSNGGTTNTIAGSHVTVPAFTWKVVLVIPKGDDDVSRVTAGSRTIAIMMPNTQGIRNNDWHQYLTTVDAVEQQTGYDFFANVPDAIENAIEAGTNGVNPPGTANQFATTAEDTPVAILLNAVSPLANPTFTYTIVSQPTHGILSGTGPNVTYAPGQDYHGPDSFTFKVNDGAFDSNTSTVTITVTEGVPVISSSGSTLASESCPPFNGAIDPGERVTVSLQVANTGNHVTSNLVATLQTSGGVIVPSAPQTYGAIAPSTSATRDFSFTATGTCGGTITATLQLQDGSTSLGTISYNFTLGVDSGGGFVCTAGCGGVRLLVTSTVNRSDSSTVRATVTVQNIGSDPANNAVLTTAKLGSTNGTPLPQNLGNIAAGASATTQVNFTNSTPGASSTLVVGGTYTGGNFSSTKRLTIP